MRLAWSRLALEELVALRRFSVERWGAEVARQYLQDIRRAAQLLCDGPERARVLRGRYRIFRVRSHYLILDIDPMERRLTVARVLHVSREIERHLP